VTHTPVKTGCKHRCSESWCHWQVNVILSSFLFVCSSQNIILCTSSIIIFCIGKYLYINVVLSIVFSTIMVRAEYIAHDVNGIMIRSTCVYNRFLLGYVSLVFVSIFSFMCMLCRLFFVLLFLILAIVLSVLHRFTDSVCPFGIFQLFLH
jgi:hypothetical protein